MFAPAGETNLVKASATINADDLETQWGVASHAMIVAHSIHTYTNPIPLSGDGAFSCDTATSIWGSARSARLNLVLTTPTAETLVAADDSWGLWKKIQPWALNWDAELAGMQSPKLQAD